MIYKVAKGWMRSGSDKVYSSEKRARYAERRSIEGKKQYSNFWLNSYNQDIFRLDYYEIYNEYISSTDYNRSPAGRGFHKILYELYHFEDEEIRDMSLKFIRETFDGDSDVETFLSKTMVEYSDSNIRTILRVLGYKVLEE